MLAARSQTSVVRWTTRYRHSAHVFESGVGYLSFSWYCLLPTADTAGTAVRIGDTMLGLAAVASTLPAWAGTAAATLLNMVVMTVCSGFENRRYQIRWLSTVVVVGGCGCRCCGGRGDGWRWAFEVMQKRTSAT